jgi:SEC-C motif-containing protein
MPDASACPCGLGPPYDACCGPLHRGERQASTAEALMRSRYAAYARGLVPYLVETLHPSRRAPDEARRVRRSLQHTRWLGLRVLAVEGGSILEATGVVAFEATYEAGGRRGVMHERSRFVREQGAWRYLDGEVAERDSP